jgi:hypothetical protein
MKTLFTIALIISLWSIANANTIYVDDSNITGIENGTIEYPFNTIEEGLAVANAGDTVYIFTGSYNPSGQQLYIENGIALQGEDSSTVFINSNIICNESSLTQPTGIYNLSCSLVNLYMPSGSSSFIIRGNILDSIDISTGSGFTFLIQNNILNAGIKDASGDNYIIISENTIVNGKIVDASGGSGTGETEFIENNFINFTATGNPDEDIAVEARSFSVTIRNNIINCTGPASGIRLTSGNPTNVIGNTITLNNGILLPETIAIENSSTYGVVTDNIIRGGYIGYYSSSGAFLFENNTISESHTGFTSKGYEEVKNNTITNCTGDGMILNGLRGPISRNIIKDNDSAGIRLLRPVDIGGGNWNGEGNNIIRNNGFYDLVIDYIPQQPETIYVMYNGWDHITLPEILQYDIFNEGGSQNIIINLEGFYTALEDEERQPTEFRLYQNYPNPFNPTTKLSFVIGHSSFVSLKVYNVLGNEVATLVDEYKPAGSYEVEFNAVGTSRDLSLTSGIYFYQLRAGSFIQTKKMILIK